MSDTQIKLSKGLETLLHSAENKELLEKCLKTLAAVYRSEMQKRYESFASGGGNWKPLSKITIERRRKGKGGGSDRILIDTGALMHAVGSMTHVGAKNETVGTYITVGFSSSSHDGGETFNEIASLHQNGGWTIIEGRKVHVPQRKILVPPNDDQKRMLVQKILAVIKAETGLSE